MHRSALETFVYKDVNRFSVIFGCDIDHQACGQYLKGTIVLLTRSSSLTKGINAESVCHLTQSFCCFRIICRPERNCWCEDGDEDGLRQPSRASLFAFAFAWLCLALSFVCFCARLYDFRVCSFLYHLFVCVFVFYDFHVCLFLRELLFYLGVDLRVFV